MERMKEEKKSDINMQHCRNRQNLGPIKTRQIRKYVRKRNFHIYVIIFTAIFTLSCIVTLFVLIFNAFTLNKEAYNTVHPSDLLDASVTRINLTSSKRLLPHLPDGVQLGYSFNSRQLLQAASTESYYQNYNNNTTSFPLNSSLTKPVDNQVHFSDLFTMEQRRKGAVVLHILGVIYMFIALAVACDEFFVPSLDVITSTLEISEDVAGATFMAAGGSAPELFTSIFGVFIAKSDIGIGTIVGSAVFNILFVIGMCAIVSQGVLKLTWWPLFRDVSFYSISLICLICFFRDNTITWQEALGLLFCYVSYVTFMKFNKTVEVFVKKLLGISCSDSTAIPTNNEDVEQQNHVSNGNIVNEGGHSTFRQGLIHLLLKSMDPLDNSRVHEAPMRLQAITMNHQQSLAKIAEETGPKKVAMTNGNSPQLNDNKKLKQNGNGKLLTTNNHEPLEGSVSIITNGSIRSNGGPQTHSHGVVADSMKTVMSTLTPVCDVSLYSPELTTSNHNGRSPSQGDLNGNGINDIRARYLANGERDSIASLNVPKGRGRLNTLSSISRQELPAEQPLDISWPSTFQKRLIYIVLAPILVPLWITLPDVRKRNKKKWFPITFIGSVIWIGAYSYLMNWWTVTIGETLAIPDAIMGLLFLSAGTSIPDLITSVIVARKGYGDMAVSSSVGSNIFDVTVGLPFPWLVHGIIFGPYTVNSHGLVCSVILLFSMLIIIIIIIAAFKWQMHKGMGATMFFMYIVFLTMSLLLHYNKIPCPKMI